LAHAFLVACVADRLQQDRFDVGQPGRRQRAPAPPSLSGGIGAPIRARTLTIPRATLGGVSGDAASRLAAIVERSEADPAAVAAALTDGEALASAVGGDLAFRWRVAVVRGVIAAPPDGDAVREAYGELVDRYREEPARLAALRPLGDEIRRLEADGTLPSALVVRSDRRPRR
jgi:hypothetical protein